MKYLAYLAVFLLGGLVERTFHEEPEPRRPKQCGLGCNCPCACEIGAQSCPACKPAVKRKGTP
jgi:hypothetical protein